MTSSSWYRRYLWQTKGNKEYSKSGFEIANARFDESDLEVDCSERCFMVTGANSGIGLATAMEIAKRGGILHLVCRNAKSMKEARSEIITTTGNDRIYQHQVNLSKPKEVAEWAEDFARSNGRLDVLINNAACLNEARQVDEAGVEKTFAVNVLATHIITTTMVPLLRRSRDPRVVIVSSAGMLKVRLDPHDLNFSTLLPFDGALAYDQTKRQLVVMNLYYAQRYEGIRFFAMHPGWADTPGVRKATTKFYETTKDKLRTPLQGADTVIWLAISEAASKHHSGLFFQDRIPTATHLPFAWTRSSTEEETLLMNKLDDILSKYCTSNINNFSIPINEESTTELKTEAANHSRENDGANEEEIQVSNNNKDVEEIQSKNETFSSEYCFSEASNKASEENKATEVKASEENKPTGVNVTLAAERGASDSWDKPIPIIVYSNHDPTPIKESNGDALNLSRDELKNENSNDGLTQEIPEVTEHHQTAELVDTQRKPEIVNEEGVVDLLNDNKRTTRSEKESATTTECFEIFFKEELKENDSAKNKRTLESGTKLQTDTEANELKDGNFIESENNSIAHHNVEDSSKQNGVSNVVNANVETTDVAELKSKQNEFIPKEAENNVNNKDDIKRTADSLNGNSVAQSLEKESRSPETRAAESQEQTFSETTGNSNAVTSFHSAIETTSANVDSFHSVDSEMV